MVRGGAKSKLQTKKAKRSWKLGLDRALEEPSGGISFKKVHELMLAPSNVYQNISAVDDEAPVFEILNKASTTRQYNNRWSMFLRYLNRFGRTWPIGPDDIWCFIMYLMECGRIPRFCQCARDRS